VEVINGQEGEDVQDDLHWEGLDVGGHVCESQSTRRIAQVLSIGLSLVGKLLGAH
jgi:hypothetical protein